MTVDPFRITAEEINRLIYAYFEDSGFEHSAFVLRYESHLDASPTGKKHVPRGSLIELLSKALLFAEVEAHWNGDNMSLDCKKSFTLLERHICDAGPPNIRAPSVASTESTGQKRKATSPMHEQPKEKRTKTGTREEKTGDAQTPVAVRNDKPKQDSAKPKTTTKAAAAKNSEAKVPEAKAPDAKAPDAKVPDAKVPEAKVPEGDSPNPVSLLAAHKTEVFVCSWNPCQKTVLASGSRDTTVHIWNIPDSGPNTSPTVDPPFTMAYAAKARQGDLTALDWSSDGKLLSIGSYDAMLRICDAKGELYYAHTQHEGPIFATQFSKSGRWLLTGSLDGSVCVWDVRQKKLHSRVHNHTECCLDVAWITETEYASGGGDGQLFVMSVNSASTLKALPGHKEEVNQLRCNASCTKLASCSDDKTARIWNIQAIMKGSAIKNNVVVLEGHTSTVSSVAWCPVKLPGDVELLATVSFDGTSRLWNTETGECLHTFKDHKGHVYTLAFSPDGRLFATGGADGWLHIYDSHTREKRWSWQGDPTKPGVFELDWQQSETLNRLALALQSKHVAVIDVAKIPELRA